MEILDALMLGVVEGLTEFLPISSTGHLILASDLLGANDERGKVFDIAATIKAHLFSAVPVASAFIVGGLIILFVERKKLPFRVDSAEAMTWLDALKVGIAQCFALIPGTSRSGATIIGGMLFGLSRRAATEFSFFLAVPTLLAAGAYDMWKNRALFAARDLPMFAVGLAAAFVCAFIVIRWLIRYVASHDFRPFAWYRIVFGAVVLLTAYFGWVNWRA